MPDATITSTASTFGTITGTFAADQSTVAGTITGIVAGTLDGSVGVPGPVGPTGPQGPEGPPGPPGPGSTWGTITGVLSAQLDLQGQLDLKAPIASPVFTGDARAVTPAFGDDDTSISTTAFVQAALAGGTAVAKNLEVYVRNQSGSTIPAGSIVYISGATGNRPLITLAQANNDANSAQTIGFVKASIANNGFGYVMVRGELENIDTSALTEGAQLYLSPTTAGAWTTTKPSAPQHLVYVGIVIRSHPTQGVILVAVQNGYELDELHDVAIASKANNDLLTYESSTNLWKNKSFSTLGLATESWVTAGFYPLASNPAGYLTSSALTPYLLKAGGVITGDIQSNNGSGYRSFDGAYKQTNVSASMIQLLNSDVGGNSLSIEWNGITFPSGKQTVHYPGTSILSGYATESWVTAGFYPLTGNPSGFLTSASLSGYATESWVTSQGYLTSSALTGYATQAWVDAQGYLQAGALTGYALESWVTSQGYLTDAPSDGNQYARKNGAWDIVSAGSSYITSVSSPLAVISGDLSVDLTPYETVSNAAATYYPLSNPSAFIDASALTGYATESWVTSQGYLTSAPVSSVAGKTGAVSLVVGDVSGAAPKASPALTGNVTITTNSTSPALVLIQDGTGDIIQFKDVTSDTTYSFIDQNGKVGTVASTTTAAGLNLPHGTAPTTPVNGDIWTTTAGLFARISGSTRQYVDFDGTQTINGNKTFSNANNTFGNSTATGTTSIASGATISGSTKTVNIGTSGAAGSTTNIAIGSTTGTSTTTLQGITNGVTQSAGDSSLKLATTAFVTTADNLKANLASPTFTGTPLSTTAAVDTNTTQIATTAYVVGQGYLKSATASATYAPLASPTFTGTPSLPTGTTAVTQTVGNNTTAVATTAFVTAAVPAFGATADISSPSSTVKATSFDNARELLLSPGLREFFQGAGNTGTSGTGAAANNNGGRWKEYVSPNLAVAGYAKGVYDTNAGSIGIAGYDRGANLTYRNWSKKVWLSGRCMIGHFSLSTYNGSANTYARISLGGYTAIAAGDMSAGSKGIGWRLQGGGASVIELQVSNGTTVTTVSSSFTPTLKQVFDWKIYSDGAGNVTLYVNDSQVATTTAGPTGTSTSGLYMEGVDTTASSTAAFVFNNLGTKMFFSI